MSDRKSLSNLNNLLSALDKFGPKDIRTVNRTYKDWNKRMQSEAASNFDEGDKVFFYHKHGYKIAGTILAINHKRIKVKSDSGVIWRVSPSLLEKEEKGKNAK